MIKSVMPRLIGIEADLLRSLDLAKRHGFEGVDARMTDVQELVKQHDVSEVKARFAETGLKPGYCTLLPMRVSVEESEWQQGMEALPELASLAEVLGYRRAMIVVLPFHETLPYEQNFELHVRRLQQMAPVLADHGLSIGLEYVSPKTRRSGQPHEFVHDMKGALELCEAVGAANVALLLDSLHWYCAGETVEDIACLKPEQVVVVHINDAIAGRPIDEQVVSDRELPGVSGVIDLDGFFQALWQIHYDGPVTCEPMSKTLNEMSDDEAAAATSAAMDQVMKGAGA